MSVPVPPPPDGVLTGTSGNLEAGEPTLGTAVLRGDCPPGPGPSVCVCGGDSSAGCPLALRTHEPKPWSPLLGAVGFEIFKFVLFFDYVIASVVGDGFVRKKVDLQRTVQYWLLMK